MPSPITTPARRPYVPGVTKCHDAMAMARLVLLDAPRPPASASFLQGFTTAGSSCLRSASRRGAARLLDFAVLTEELGDSVGKPFVRAALAAGIEAVRPAEPPVAVMPVWGFEPEGDTDDVLLGSARLWGADLLIEALRVSGEDEPVAVPSNRNRYDRWATAAGSERFLPMPVPGRSECYALFASLTRG